MINDMGNSLIVIEGGHLSTYVLDDRIAWTVGRPSPDNKPDIEMHSLTISRRHGKFICDCGMWMYVDNYGKNGTVYNGQHLKKNSSGKPSPVMLENGDVLVFGGNERPVINHSTVWAMFIEHSVPGEWHVKDTKGMKQIQFSCGEWSQMVETPEKGKVFDRQDGIAIYMGDITYLSGDMDVREMLERGTA